MSKTPSQRTRTRNRARARRPSSGAPIVDVMTQLECATRHLRAALLGGLLGGVIPWFARELAHREIPEAWSAGRVWLAGIMLGVVLGCAAFSMLTVYKFGRAAFADARKAAGFVAALEGVMLVADGTTSVVALGLLVAINAVANGCVIALSREATARRQEADARRSATRAQNRAQARGTVPTSATSSTTATPPRAAASTMPAPASRAVPGPIPVVQGHRRAPTAARAARLTSRSRFSRWASGAVDDAEIVSEEMYS